MNENLRAYVSVCDDVDRTGFDIINQSMNHGVLGNEGKAPNASHLIFARSIRIVKRVQVVAKLLDKWFSDGSANAVHRMLIETFDHVRFDFINVMKRRRTSAIGMHQYDNFRYSGKMQSYDQRTIIGDATDRAYDSRG